MSGRSSTVTALQPKQQIISNLDSESSFVGVRRIDLWDIDGSQRLRDAR